MKVEASVNTEAFEVELSPQALIQIDLIYALAPSNPLDWIS